MLLPLWAATALATEVVWLDPPTDAQAAQVAEAAAATGPALSPLELRAAATDWSEADADAYALLADRLREVRTFETRLDGELVIMRDLARPLSALSIVRDDADREQVFAALAYQGFAVHRYFDAGLATAAEAAPYRVELLEEAYVQPWVDAVALDPERNVTAYEIAEAPQRVAYGMTRDMVVKSALPAELAFPGGLPDGATLTVDGRRVAVDGAGAVRLPPGRHLVHVAVDGHVLARFDLRLEPAGQQELSVAPTDAEWKRWLEALRTTTPAPPPPSLAPHLEALGGEVVVAWGTGGELSAVRVTAREVTELSVTPAPASTRSGHRPAQGLGAALAVHGGWLSSGDFYLQNPLVVPHEPASVNAGTAGLTAEVRYDRGLLRIAGGASLIATLGRHHVAQYGSRTTRLRPYPYAAVGLTYGQLTAGYLFPHHPALGARATVPLPVADLEVHAGVLYGLSATLDEGDADAYTTNPILAAQIGLGWRLGR